MVKVKDKSVTVEALKALHDYNKTVFETKFDKPENNIVPIENGGTNSNDGATGLANLFAAGITVLSANQYGDELPEPGTPGRIFFKRIIEESEASESDETV